MYEAWKRVKANKGSSGVDGITIEDIEAKGVNRYLTEIQTELKPFILPEPTEDVNAGSPVFVDNRGRALYDSNIMNRVHSYRKEHIYDPLT